MNITGREKIGRLISKGVHTPLPESVYIGPEVDCDRIYGNNITIYPGSRIVGERTLILSGANIGKEAPAMVENCCVGKNVTLGGGFFKNAVFLEGATMGSCAHVREGTILEEQSGGAHTVGLKQTVLFPFVTLGSLINFCDCFMSGGTSRKNHSEVGSSYIHFNYTPNQDKATPSLIGEVPAGVMLNQAPVFLGGQGGLVGPCRIGFGVVTAAGTIQRKDALKPGRIYLEPAVKLRSMPFTPGLYVNIKRIVTLNLLYIANLTALMHWYKHIRSQFISDGFPKTLWQGLIQTLETAIGERVKRLVEVAEKMPQSIDIFTSISEEGEKSLLVRQKKQLYEKREELRQALPLYDNYPGNPVWKEEFVNIVQNRIAENEGGYLTVIQGLAESEAETGTKWLRSIADEMLEDMQNRLPHFK